MATWVTHLMIADRVLQRIPELKKHEFCVGILRRIVMLKTTIGQALHHRVN